jgi:metal-responsive CopG/Arc/MetJ family transcriptional regulator
MKRTSIFFPEQLLERFRELAARRGTPMAELIRQAMEAFLDAQEARKDGPH